MENSKELTFEERKRIQLEMLDEIDKFCDENDIRYSLAFGTLLGAIRHKGFIPWDDDVDIMMPLPDLIRFKKSFKSEICEYVDVDTNKNHDRPFSRVAHTKTYSNDGLVVKGLGVCIDLYIMVTLPSEHDRFFSKLNRLYNRRFRFIRYRHFIINHFPVKTIPFFSYVVKKCRDYYLVHCQGNITFPKYYIVAGPLSLRGKMMYDRNIFSTIELAQFEDKQYKIIGDWDYYLTLRYNNYMQLPPESERHPYHCQHYYWK